VTSTPSSETAPVPPKTVTAVADSPRDTTSDVGSGFWKGGGGVLLGVLPALVWAAFAVWTIRFLAPQIISLVGRLRSFKGLGIELEFAIDGRLERAAENQRVTVALTQRIELRARLSLVGGIVRGVRILWVDDVPENNVEERALLSELGARIRQANNTKAALTELRTQTFDVVISDMKRGEEPTAGLTLLAEMRQSHFNTPVIIYTGTDQLNQLRPANVFGITNRPDELVHLVLDAHERQLIPPNFGAMK
jgi:CheY-like chemotaxis protein